MSIWTRFNWSDISLNEVKILISKGANTNATDDLGNTPLHYATACNRLEIAKELIDRGADVNACNKDKNTPLHIAAFKGQTEFVKLLIEAGANVNVYNKDGSVPLHYWYDQHTERTKMLLDAGADINAQNIEGTTLLHKAVYWGHREIIMLLMKHDADVLIKDKHGKTPRDYARMDMPDIAGLLYEAEMRQTTAKAKARKIAAANRTKPTQETERVKE